MGRRFFLNEAAEQADPMPAYKRNALEDGWRQQPGLASPSTRAPKGSLAQRFCVTAESVTGPVEAI